MKAAILVLICFFAVSANAERFDGVVREVEQVAGYSQNASYDQNHCIINFTSDLPSACDNKNRGVVYLDKEVGQFMCSVALASFATSKKLVVSSYDDCDPIHKSPVLRWVGIKN